MCLSTNNTGCRPIWRKLRGIPPNTKEFQSATGACYIDPGNNHEGKVIDLYRIVIFNGVLYYYCLKNEFSIIEF